MGERSVAGGGRQVDVPPERLSRWLENFGARHGVFEMRGLGLHAADGAVALLEPAFGAPAEPGVDGLLAHVLTDRRVGLLLVRLGGHAAGVFEGRRLVASKVGSRQVHGRSAAGGWSQQRFARRRDGQVSVAHQAAADVAVRILAGEGLVVTGGDRTAVGHVLADPRLTGLVVQQRFLTVPDPRKAVLVEAVDTARATRVTLL